MFGRIRLLKIGERLDRAYDAVKQYRRHRGAPALSFAAGIGVQATLSLAWYSVARAFGGTVPLVYYFVFIPLLNIVDNIPTIGGLGVREWAFVLFFTPTWLTRHLSQELALASALLFLALDLVFAWSEACCLPSRDGRPDLATRGRLSVDVAQKEDVNATSSQTEH